MEKIEYINLEKIPIKRSIEWDIISTKYNRKYCRTQDRGFCWTSLFWLFAHIHKQSCLFHGLAGYLYKNISEYSKRPSYSYLLLESALLNAVYVFRECLANILNEIYELKINFNNADATKDLLKGIHMSDPEMYKKLEEIGPRSTLFEFIETYRNPYVHEEHLSKTFSTENFLKAAGGMEQPRFLDFINKSHDLSVFLENKEKEIIHLLSKRLSL